jgi:propionyl-CoA carboxylase beta chain
VDPSSSLSGGSILGDKTRMEQLSTAQNAFIRPSPTSGSLGGVAARTREAISVCEAAGYDVIVVETVGVGQSETAVAEMVDVFVLLQLPHAGDDLQAIKKGIVELADIVVINKADLDPQAAATARRQWENALGMLHSASPGWRTPVLEASATKSERDRCVLAPGRVVPPRDDAERRMGRQAQAPGGRLDVELIESGPARAVSRASGGACAARAADRGCCARARDAIGRGVVAACARRAERGGEAMKEIIRQLEEKRAAARLGGGQKRIDAQHAKGKLSARERIELLLDPKSFEEWDMFVEHRCNDFGMAQNRIPGDGVVTGYGTVNGRLVFVFSQDFTVFGGALSKPHAEKICKIMDHAMRVGAPVDRPERFRRRADPGRRRIARRLRRSVPAQRAALGRDPADLGDHGPVRGRRGVFAGDDRLHLHGEGLVVHVRHRSRGREDRDARGSQRRGAGRRADAHDEVGRRRCRVRERRRGAADDAPADQLPAREQPRSAAAVPTDDPSDRIEMSLDKLVPDNPNQSYDIKELIIKIVDENDFFELQRDSAKNIVIGFARMGGTTVGIVANQPLVLAGCLDIKSAIKGARFVRFCDAFNIPIVTFVDVPGIHAGHRAGVRRHHQARREAAVRVRRVHGAEGHR